MPYRAVARVTEEQEEKLAGCGGGRQRARLFLQMYWRIVDVVVFCVRRRFNLTVGNAGGAAVRTCSNNYKHMTNIEVS